MKPRLYYSVTLRIGFCHKYITLVILGETKKLEYLYCDNPRFYVFISDPHFLSGIFRMGIGISSHGADDLTHANYLQKSLMFNVIG